jgi:hypothetical protein
MTGMTLTWAAVLDDWQAFLDELEDALDRGVWQDRADAAAWSPPGDLPEAPSAAEERRVLELADRAGRLRDRLEAALRTTSAELGDERRKAVGAIAYRRQGR